MQGEIVLPIRFDAVSPWLKQYFLIKKDDLLGWTNEEGKLIVEPKYQELKPAGKLIAGKILGLWGLVDYMGIQKLPALYISFEVSEDKQFALIAKEIKTEIIPLHE